MIYQGPESPKILFVSDFQRVHCRAEGKVFSEWLGAPLLNSLKRTGITSDAYGFICLHDGGPGARDLRNVPDGIRQSDLDNFRGWLALHRPAVVVPLGEYALATITGLKSISKWQCSVVPAKAEYGGVKCLPLFHPEHISRVYSDHFYLTVGAQKLAKEMQSPAFSVPERTFLLNPPLGEALDYLAKVAEAPLVAIDWEFGRGQLNTIGFAVSATEAIAIRCLPDDYSPEQYMLLFKAIAKVLEGPSGKIVQANHVEVLWAARYGIQVNNVVHDTMWAMKFLHPEFDKGLDNVGRLYTPFPYWKDDNDDWANVRNWQQHLEYNCKDTTGTFAAYEAQLAALRSRKLDTVFAWVMRFAPLIQEMCVTGLRVNPKAIDVIRENVTREQENFARIIDDECLAALGKTINVRSPKQLKEALEAMGMKLPTKKVKGKADLQTTTDKKALVKLKRKYPKAQILPALIGISAANKRLSSYVDFDYDRQLSRVHYSLDGCGTETGRWAGYSAPWGEGFNPQTVPKAVRGCFTADEGHMLIQIDLKQAESRFVAWDAPDPTLMQLITDNRDIHKYVAGRIFNKPEEMVKDLERQLGKKAGHAANYGTGPRTFAEACLVEMNHYIDESEAKHVLDTYFQTFPGIKARQERIKREVYAKRMLRTPLGRERHFFGRMDDSTYREAYAYAPQSTIPDITNCLMLALWDNRDYLGLAWHEGGRFLLQVHDSLLLQARPERVGELAAFCRDLSAWHPHIELAGGKLLIPTDVEAGRNWKTMEKI